MQAGDGDSLIFGPSHIFPPKYLSEHNGVEPSQKHGSLITFPAFSSIENNGDTWQHRVTPIYRMNQCSREANVKPP